ncbi:MAG: glucan biosynthesis protein G [Nitrosomonadales bacterium]|nr:glucan biosynthesis protein G [Nitrosomonadales bacterium]
MSVAKHKSAGSRGGVLFRLMVVGLLGLAAGNVFAFDFADVAQRAKALAAAPYETSNTDLPKELKALGYDQYRDIRFRPDQAHWRASGLPFELTFFHAGYLYEHSVKINEVTADGVREIAFDPALFNYGKSNIDTGKIRHAGFAGFCVRQAINTPKHKDEVLAFLGASYFRALGKGQSYGLSARGLAIDTALSGGEEFPQFVEFWIERPTADAEELQIYALLDSPRMAGAYRFVMKPGVDTVLDVKAQLYARTSVGKLGIAPLTSMFFFGENQPPKYNDYRPEVHDSDGLSIQLGNGEWVWRPLINPTRLLTTSFATVNPIGFGLMQRDREFLHYEDLESRFERRPSAWVEPKGQWGAGRVELVQLPTPDETNDNIVAYWVPDKTPRPNEAYDIEYLVHWQKTTERRPPSAWVTQTRRGRAFVQQADDSIGFIVEFDGPALRKITDKKKIKSLVSAGANGQILENTLYRNEATGVWRLVLRVRRQDANESLELRASLQPANRKNNSALSETWSYILPPE